ncbi:MAG: hypothetical protein Q7W45_07925 [Bacteroidota bacterium]|nr:hypothetical protein [Bacteroidota bacterium]MDP3145978.1 hypothetical protein [Bacteroidota bacterium]
MKKLIFIALMGVFEIVNANAIMFCEGGKCTGSKYCSACKNCSRCKHCSSGGVCGVCSPKSFEEKKKTVKNKVETKTQTKKK